MGKFQKGHPRIGGRQAGSKNKRTSVWETCEAAGLDPFKEMARIGADRDNPNQLGALRELCQYIEPKRKAVEVSGGLDLRVQQELDALMGLSEEELKELLKAEAKK